MTAAYDFAEPRLLAFAGRSDPSMAYRFKLDEPFDKGVRRIARAQVELALLELGDGAVPAAGVHSCRKAIKRLRALVRLVGSKLDKHVAKRHERTLKQAAKLLSEARDRAVLIETIGKLKARADGDVVQHLTVLSQYVGAGIDAEEVLYEDRSAARVRRLLKAVGRDFDDSAIKGRSFSVIAQGLEASYRRGRNAIKHVSRAPSSEAYHELRKAVQWHWRHMSLLALAWPDMFALRIAEVRELSQRLGDDHDMAVLVQAARKGARAADCPLTPVGAQAIAALAASEQFALRCALRGRAERVFAEKPGAFATRMAALWSAARRMEQSKKSGVQPIPSVKPRRLPVQVTGEGANGNADAAPRLVIEHPRAGSRRHR